MYPYSVHIMELLGEGTEKEKYEYLRKIQGLLSKIGYPRRGTTEETMTIQDAADEAQKLVNEHGVPHNYKPREY